jgi:cell division protein ZapA
MSKTEPKAVSVSVMGREFRLAAPAGEERQLLASVDLLNRKMKEIKDTGKVVGNERIAIMAALNLAHEHLHYLGASANLASVTTAAAPSTNASTAASIDEAYVQSRIHGFETILERAVSEQEKLF